MSLVILIVLLNIVTNKLEWFHKSCIDGARDKGWSCDHFDPQLPLDVGTVVGTKTEFQLHGTGAIVSLSLVVSVLLWGPGHLLLWCDVASMKVEHQSHLRCAGSTTS